MVQPTKISKTFCLNCFREQTWIKEREYYSKLRGPVLNNDIIPCCDNPDRRWIQPNYPYTREALIKRAMENLS